MNLPNRLTAARLVISPLFFFSFMLPTWFGEGLKTLSTVLVLVLFTVNELTDLLDGKIARSRNLITDLGKVMDPFADVFSRLTYFVCLMNAGIMPVLAFIIILWRELGILFVRMLMMGRGKAVPANIFGKSKAVLYAVCGVCGIILHALNTWCAGSQWLEVCAVVMNILFYLAAFASAASFMTYIAFIRRDGALRNLTR